METKHPIAINDRIGIWAAAAYSILFITALLTLDAAEEYTIPGLMFVYVIVFVISTIIFTGVVYLTKYLNENGNRILEILVTYILLLAVVDVSNAIFGNDMSFSELSAHSIIMTVCIMGASFLASTKNNKGE